MSDDDLDLSSLDEQYRQYLQVRDADLAFLNPAQFVQSLALGRTAGSGVLEPGMACRNLNTSLLFRMKINMIVLDMLY